MGGTWCGRLRGAEGNGGNHCSEGEVGWEKVETLMNGLAPGGSGYRWMQAEVGGQEGLSEGRHGPASGV